jgi:hypothetical protein
MDEREGCSETLGTGLPSERTELWSNHIQAMNIRPTDADEVIPIEKTQLVDRSMVHFEESIAQLFKQLASRRKFLFECMFNLNMFNASSPRDRV